MYKWLENLSYGVNSAFEVFKLLSAKCVTPLVLTIEHARLHKGRT